MRSQDLCSFGFFVQEFINLRYSAIKGDHGEAVVVHIQNQILPHHGQADDGNVSLRFHSFVVLISSGRIPYSRGRCGREQIDAPLWGATATRKDSPAGFGIPWAFFVFGLLVLVLDRNPATPLPKVGLPCPARYSPAQ